MLTVRTKLGWVGLFLIAVAILGVLPTTGTGLHYFAGAAFKVGCVTLLAWLAYPQLLDLPRLVKPILLVVAVVAMALSPSLFASLLRVSVLVIPLWIALQFWPQTDDVDK